MKNFFLIIFAFLTFFSCEKKVQSPDFTKITELVSYKYEGGNFILKSGNNTTVFETKNLPAKKAILLNSSMCGYFSELKIEDRIVGISSPEYVFSPKIKANISENLTQNVGNEQKFDIEKIISLKPDVIVTNYISSFENTYKILKNQGIKIVFLDEYREQDPLDKTAYLKVFGLLFGKKNEAEDRFNQIKYHYDSIKNLAKNSKNSPKVIANEIYGNQWFLPGGKTAFAKMVKDANADYILKNNDSESAVPLSFEEVLVQSKDAQFWVNAGNHSSKKEMLGINQNYSKINAFSKGKIYAVTAKENGKANDFFESGVVRADLVLKDFVMIFHPEIFPKDKLIYYRELQ